MSPLHAHLDALVANMASQNPEWLNGLFPGLHQDEIDQTAALLHPFQLPAEVEALYRWRNGQSGADTFMPGYTFLPLAEAVSLYQDLLALGIGWHDAWFPVFNFEGDNFIVILNRQKAESTPVWRCDNENTHIFLWHENLAAMVQAMSACFKEGIYFDAGGYWDTDETRETAVRLRYSSRAFQAGAIPSPPTAVDRFDDSQWPSSWTGGAALPTAAPQPEAIPLSIAAYLENPPAGQVTLQGRVTQLVGSPKATFIRFMDETGELPLHAAGRLARKLRMRESYELTVLRDSAEHSIFLDPSLTTRYTIKKVTVWKPS